MTKNVTKYPDRWAVQLVRLSNKQRPIAMVLCKNSQSVESARRSFLDRLERADALTEFGVETYNPGAQVPNVDYAAETPEEWCDKVTQSLSKGQPQATVEEPTHLVVSDINDKVIYYGPKDQALALMRAVSECGGQATLFRKTTVEDEEL